MSVVERTRKAAGSGAALGVARERLPNRRMQITDVVDWQGSRWTVSVGFDRKGQAREVFIKGVKVGSALDAIMDDACVMLSLLMQAGVSAGQLALHLGREGVDPTAPAASPLGLVVQACADMESEVGADMAKAHDVLAKAGFVPSGERGAG